MPPPMEPPLLLLTTVVLGVLALLLAGPWGPPRAPVGLEKPFWCGGRRGEAVGGGRCLGGGEGWG